MMNILSTVTVSEKKMIDVLHEGADRSISAVPIIMFF